jgi:peptide/nickel transport system permease protein
MSTYVLRRVATGAIALFGLTLVMFFIVHLVPGDPAVTLLGPRATPEAIATLHREWGLNQPIYDQYEKFMSHLIHGDMGASLFFHAPVTSLIKGRLPATLLLLAYSTLLAVLITVPLATIAALRQGGVVDQFIRVVSLIGLGAPAVWMGLVLILFLAVRLGAFPVGGYSDSTGIHLQAMFLPSLTVALGMFPTLTRSLRASLISVLAADYITNARARGLSGYSVVIRHGVRNAIAPTVTVLGLNVGYLVGSTVAVEVIFAIPGIGNLMVQAVLSRDFPIVQGVTIVYGILVLSINLLTDLTHAALDPRVVLE